MSVASMALILFGAAAGAVIACANWRGRLDVTDLGHSQRAA
jgi:hypothetical protein